MQEIKYNLFSLVVKDQPRYDCYATFIVAAESIPDALEYMYNYVCRKEVRAENGFSKFEFDSIPFYLRSSNIIITNLGEFIPKEKLWKNNDHIICVHWIGD